jgi:hypothetical protein
MPKPAKPDTVPDTMLESVCFSQNALDAACEMDIDLTDADRTFMAGERATLEPARVEVRGAIVAIEEHDLGAASRAQAKVVLGDVVQDRVVRDSNRSVKAELPRSPGLGADHAFGARVDDLVRTKLELEPAAVQRAAERLGDLPEFPSRDRIRERMMRVAGNQTTALTERKRVEGERDRLEVAAARAVINAATALQALEARLLARFPGQYDYVGSFFMATSARRARRAKEPSQPTEPTA